MWEQIGTLWRYRGRFWPAGGALAMFDFDSTLHRYRGRGPDSALGVALVAALSGSGGRGVVIFSNRSSPAETGLSMLKAFVAAVENAGGSCDVYAATGRDRNRKPQTGAWEAFLRDRGVVLSPGVRAGSYYCGDAAGREGDFSASDRNFARNIGMRFFVPEQLFGEHNVVRPISAPARDPAPPLGEGPPPSGHALRLLDKELSMAASPAARGAYIAALAAIRGRDVILLVGSPASGKSTFARALATHAGYEVVSQDIHGDKHRTQMQMLAFLAAQRRVVVDNTHRDYAAREAYIAPVRNHYPEATIGIVWIKTPEIVCKHLDGLRCDLDITGKTTLLPPAAIPRYWAAFEEPDSSRHRIQTATISVTCALAPTASPKATENRYAP